MTPFESIELVVDDPEWGRLRYDAHAAGPGDGPLALLLHGCPQTKHEWRHQIPVLADAGFRVVAVDQRGYSPNARPYEIEAYRIDRLTADVLAFADQLGADRFHLVGHDYGAVLAWQVAGRHQDRLITMATLTVPHPLAYLEAYELGTQAEMSSYFETFRDTQTEVGFGAEGGAGLRAVYEAVGFGPEETEVYVNQLGSTEAMRGALNWYRAVGPYMIEGLQPITVPVLFLYGTADVALSIEGARRTAAHVRGPYTYVQLEGASHWMPEQATAEVNRHLLSHLSFYA